MSFRVNYEDPLVKEELELPPDELAGTSYTRVGMICSKV